MAVWFGTHGVCHWACVLGAITDEDMDAFAANLHRVTHHVAPGDLVLDITHNITRPTATQRKRIADIINGAPNAHLLGGHALVTNSAVGRGVLTAINWMVRKPFPEAVLGSVEEAVGWLQQRQPTWNGAGLVSQLQRDVQGFSALQW